MKTPILTERQEEILTFIASSIDDFGYPPSIPEIQEEFSFKSPNAAQDHLKALARKGCIFRHPHKSRGIELMTHAVSADDLSEVTPTLYATGFVFDSLEFTITTNLNYGEKDTDCNEQQVIK